MARASTIFLVALAAAPAAAVARQPMPPLAFVDGEFNIGDTIKGLPTTIKNSFRQFKAGMGQMWRNGKEASAIRKRVAALQPPATNPADALSFTELVLLRKAGEDTLKLVQAGAVWLFIPELFPALLYFYPRALPSTFESEAGKAKRHGTLARMRTRSAVEYARPQMIQPQDASLSLCRSHAQPYAHTHTRPAAAADVRLRRACSRAVATPLPHSVCQAALYL